MGDEVGGLGPSAGPIIGPNDAPRRNIALDVFRGITIFAMLIVNNVDLGDATPNTLIHADWGEAPSFADFVFPWFLLAMGIATGLSRRVIPLGKVASRVIALLVLGMFLDSAVTRQLALGLGVLQLIGLSYGVAALARRLPLAGRALVAVAGLAAHTWILCGSGAPLTPDGNAITALNAQLNPYGLRGLVSVLSTGALAIAGSLVGTLLRKRPEVPFMGWAVLAGGIAMAAGLASERWVPYSKAIWSASYILVTGGAGVVALGLLSGLGFWLDRALTDGARRVMYPFITMGANPLVLYAGPILVKVMIFQVWHLGRGPFADKTLAQAGMAALTRQMGPVTGGVAYLAILILVWWLVSDWMYRRQIFVRV